MEGHLEELYNKKFNQVGDTKYFMLDRRCETNQLAISLVTAWIFIIKNRSGSASPNSNPKSAKSMARSFSSKHSGTTSQGGGHKLQYESKSTRLCLYIYIDEVFQFKTKIHGESSCPILDFLVKLAITNES